jgi:hypothetical protein
MMWSETTRSSRWLAEYARSIGCGGGWSRRGGLDADGCVGMVAVTELVDCLNMIKLLAAAIGPIKARDRAHTGGELLVGMAAAKLIGRDDPGWA